MTVDASVDFTGGIPQIVNLVDKNFDGKSFFNFLKNMDSNKAFMGCSVAVRFMLGFFS